MVVIMAALMEDNTYGFNNATAYAFTKHQLCALEGETQIKKMW